MDTHSALFWPLTRCSNLHSLPGPAGASPPNPDLVCAVVIAAALLSFGYPELLREADQVRAHQISRIMV